MYSRPLLDKDRPALEALLRRAPTHTVFNLSALSEYGLMSPGDTLGSPWAIGAFEGGVLVGALVVFRGTGGVYHPLGDQNEHDVLVALAEAVHDAVMRGRLALLSGHASQMDPLIPMVEASVFGRTDRCYFCTLLEPDLSMPPLLPGFSEPRLATEDDMEPLIDFYLHGFYSLARLPSRLAWRNRLSEQMTFRTLFLMEDAGGKVISAAQSSAEGAETAMLGGVATLDEYRGRGLSTWCVGALCRHLFSTGTERIALFYLQDNIPAARVYDKLGFKPAGEWLLVPMGLGILFGNL